MRLSTVNKRKALLLAAALLALLLLAAFFVPFERESRLGRLPVASAETLAVAAEAEAAPALYWNGTELPPSGGVYYLPQSMDTAGWSGQLVAEGGWKLYATENAAAQMADRAALLAGGEAVELVAVNGGQKAVIRVVFTGMPVLCLTTNRVEEAAEDEKTRFYGQMTLFNTDGTAQSCAARYNERGSYSLAYDKKGYKLNLLNAEGGNLHLPLLGLRSDDDWQLRALYTDPQKSREITAGALWNELAAAPQDYPTSSMDYVELIVDGDYRGLYLLAERLDDKTVNAKETDILYKNGLDTMASNFTTANLERQPFVLKDGHMGKVKIYGLSDAVTEPWTPYEQLMDLLYNEDTEENPPTYAALTALLNVDNAIDWGLFKQALGLYDNDLHNLYWLAREEDTGYRMYYIPYDMDLSFGHFPDGLTEEPFGLLDWGATKMYDTPALTALLNANSEEIAPRVNERWVQLRQSTLSNDHIFALLDAAEARVTGSGALARDAARWPGEYDDPDLTATKAWMEQRLALLDSYYGPAGWAAE